VCVALLSAFLAAIHGRLAVVPGGKFASLVGNCPYRRNNVRCAPMDLRADIMIEAPSAAAWAVIGERFASIDEWAGPITTSTLDGELGPGAVRTCRLAGFGPLAPGVIRERLIDFDPQHMTLAYESIDGMPQFIQKAMNRWSVHAIGETRCLVRSRATLKLRGPIVLVSLLFRWRMQVNAARVLDELRHHVERGQPHQSKARTRVVTLDAV
jgi:hypothetical protein